MRFIYLVWKSSSKTKELTELFHKFIFFLVTRNTQRGSRGQNECHLSVSVLGNISTTFLALSVGGNMSTSYSLLVR